jgi:Stage II sporulation protein E (SpoIIE)
VNLGSPSSGRDWVRALSRRATVLLVLVALTAALGAGAPGASALGITIPSPLGGGPLVKVSLGEKSSEAESSSAPLVGISTSSSGGSSQVGVSLGGEPVVSVKTPSLPVVELPTTTTTVANPVAPTKPSGSTTTTSSETSSGSGSGSSNSPRGGTDSASAASVGASGSASRTGVASARSGSAAKGTHRAAARSNGAAKGSGPATVSDPSGGLTVTPQGGLAAGDGRASRKATSSNPLASIGHDLPLPLPVPDWSKPIILLLLLLALWFGVRSRLATRRAKRLERRQVVLLRDLDAMQAALVPEVDPVLSGLGVSVAYRPAEGPAAGGDFYEVFEPEPGRVAVILGDVVGHGHEALKQAALVRYTLRAYVSATSEPRAALALTGRALAGPDCEQLATVAVAVWDAQRGTMTYALAGHPPPILTGSQAQEAPAKCSSPPVGWTAPTGRRQRTISMAPGARACLFSDGLIEARSVEGEGGAGLLGRERLREMLAALPAEAGAQELLAEVRSAAMSTPDDMAACILTPTETPVAGPRIDLEELEVDRAAVKGGHLQEFLTACGIEARQVERLLARIDRDLAVDETAIVLVDRSGESPVARLGEMGSVEPPKLGDLAMPAGPARPLLRTN